MHDGTDALGDDETSPNSAVPASGDGPRTAQADADPGSGPTPVETRQIFLDGLLAHSSGAVFVRDAVDGRYLLVSNAFAKLADRPVGEIVGAAVGELFGEAIANEELRHDRMIRTDGQARASMERIVDAQGRERQIVVHKFPLYDQSGTVFAIGAVAADLTSAERDKPIGPDPQYQPDAYVQISTMLSDAPVGLMFIGPDGLVMAANSAMCEILGYTQAEFIGQPAIGTIASQSRQELESDVVELLAGRRAHLNAIRWLVHRDGHGVPARMTTTVFRNDDGAPRYMMAMIFDLTEDERAREELARAHTVAVQATERLTLLHAIATAANEAQTFDALAPKVLAIVCERLGYTAGAVFEWIGEVQHCAHEHGTVRPPTRPPADADPTLTEGGSGPQVQVPLPEVDGVARSLQFEVPETEFSDWQPDLFRLIASECGRVMEREAAARAQRESERRFRSVFDTSPLAMGLTSSDRGVFTDVNDALCRLLGRSREELCGMRFRAILHPHDWQILDTSNAVEVAGSATPNTVEMRLLHADGSTVICEVSLAIAASGHGAHLLLVQIEDVTARRTAETALRWQVDHDSLTRLVNRSYLMRELAVQAHAGACCALLFVDLDGFKEVNDSCGHDIGDEVLVAVAHRLRAAVRPADVVARFGGDEFVVLCPMMSGQDCDVADAAARQVAERIAESVSAPIATSSRLASVTASIGIASGSLQTIAAQDLLQQADTAMYRAKRMGKDRTVVYDPALDAAAGADTKSA